MDTLYAVIQHNTKHERQINDSRPLKMSRGQGSEKDERKVEKMSLITDDVK